MRAEHSPARRVRRWLLVAGVVAAAGIAGVLATTVAMADQHDQPPPQIVILARSDVPADALASGPVGGALGAPVLITPSDSLHSAAAQAIQQIDPDLVVLAGGTAALSPAVEQAVQALGYQTQRAAGPDRHATAVELAAVMAQYNTSTQLVVALQERVDELEALVAAIEGVDDVEGLLGRVDALEALLTGFSRPDADTLLAEGLNLQLVNGEGQTDSSNGLGNLIIGYNVQSIPAAQRTGSHYLVVGDQHEWTAYGGIVVGLRNTATGNWAAVSGGRRGTASGDYATVSGGSQNNIASGEGASVTGGSNNTASGSSAHVSGGTGNIASGSAASVTAGFFNTASNSASAVHGGSSNTASGNRASILGGNGVTLATTDGTHPN